MKLFVLLITTVFVLELCAESKPVLNLDFEKGLSSGIEITGGKIVAIPDTKALITDKKRKSNFLHLNGRNEVLLFNLSEESKKVLDNSFTFEFDFFTEKLPSDRNHHNPGAYNIDIFSAFDENGEDVFNFYGNYLNRFTCTWVNEQGQRSGLQSTWNHNNNYEVCGILRNKWYHIAFVFDAKTQTVELYLDGEKVGQTKTKGNLKTIKEFRFGGNPKGNYKGMLSGGIDNIRLSSGIIYNKETDSVAQKKSWQRLHDAARNEYSKFLPPENPKWAENHPRMLLTPARIEVLKASLKKGKGPELLARLIAECDEMIDPASPQFFNKMTIGHNIGYITRPAMLSLATILTGEKKYAEHAARIVTEYTDTLGYYDMRTQLVYSAGQAKPLMAVALTYDWVYEYFTTEQRRKVRQYFLEIAKGTYDLYTKKSESSAQSDALKGWIANWSAMSFSTLGNACLAIMGETSAPVRKWLNYAKFRAMQYGLFAIGSKGCFYEMPGYLAYGAGPLFIFMEAYYTAGGDDLLAESNFAKTPEFLPYIFYPYNNKMMPLRYSTAISGLHRDATYIMALFRYKFKSKSMEWDWQKIYNESPWDKSWNMFPILWYQPENETVKSPGLPLAKWFKNEGFMGFRSSWAKDAVAGTFTAYPAEIMAHDQSDRGQFNLYGYQGRWIIDPGGRSKPEHAYRGSHNLITVDNQERCYKPMVGSNYHLDAFITNYCHSDKIATIAESDLSNSYRYIYNWEMETVDSKGKKYSQDRFDIANRQLVFMREKTAPEYLLILDKMKKDDQKHTYTLNLHTASGNDVQIHGDQAHFIQYPQNSKKLKYVCYPKNKDGSRRYYYSGNPAAGYAEYLVNIPEDGYYDLYGYGCPGKENCGAMDSFFISFAGKKINWGTNNIEEYRWSKINIGNIAAHKDQSASSSFKLKKGQYKLQVLLREPEAKVARFAVVSANTLPVFDKPNQKNIIMIDAEKVDTIVKGFVVNSEEVNEDVPAAEMYLALLSPSVKLSKEIFPGTPLPHYRLQASIRAVSTEFLTFYYPNKPGMEQPEITKINQNTSLIQWKTCSDLICIKTKKEIDIEGIKSDADLVVIRKQGDSVISFVMTNGTFLTFKDRELIRLAGGKGIAVWTADSLAVSGENVFNFTFNFPLENKRLNIFSGSKTAINTATANGKRIEVSKNKHGWQADSPFNGNKVLKW
jgi:hypothetical protein